jgi:hypothetical protein
MNDKMRNRNQAKSPGKTEHDDRKLPENSKKSLDKKLDEGVEESFPASDPVSVKITK